MAADAWVVSEVLRPIPSAFPSAEHQAGYFNEFVGPEYGNVGMQSSVSGCASGACGGGATVDYGGSYGGGAAYPTQAAPQIGLGGPTVGGEVQGIVNQAVQGAIDAAIAN